MQNVFVIEAVESLASRPPVADEVAVSQNPEMVRYVRHTAVEEFCDVADAEFVLGEKVYDLCPGRIPQGLEQLSETVQVRDGFLECRHHLGVRLKHIA